MPTKIPWTQETWNPITGCTPFSEGCENCYAKRMVVRFAGRFGYPTDEPFRPGVLHEDKLNVPKRWRKPRTIFVTSMGDFFHDAVKYSDQNKIYDVMKACPQHRFLLLTKRPSEIDFAFRSKIFSSTNIFLGITAENQYRYLTRCLEQPYHFLSLEPLLGPVKLNVAVTRDNLPSWVIVGGETGRNVRPMLLEWARDIRDECKDLNIPFFFKQVGGLKKYKTAPKDLKIREYPSWLGQSTGQGQLPPRFTKKAGFYDK